MVEFPGEPRDHHGAAPSVLQRRFAQKVGKKKHLIGVFSNKVFVEKYVTEVDTEVDAFRVFDSNEDDQFYIEKAYGNGAEDKFGKAVQFIDKGTWPLARKEKKYVADMIAALLVKDHSRMEHLYNLVHYIGFDHGLRTDMERYKEWILSNDYSIHNTAVKLGFRLSQELGDYFVNNRTWILIRSQTPFFTGPSSVVVESRITDTFNAYSGLFDAHSGPVSLTFPIDRKRAICLVTTKEILEDRYMADDESVSRKIREVMSQANKSFYFHPNDREFLASEGLFS